VISYLRQETYYLTIVSLNLMSILTFDVLEQIVNILLVSTVENDRLVVGDSLHVDVYLEIRVMVLLLF
jgi:hypothetical protein